jgi:nicotinate-nucleotide adenylyltransferase
MIGVLGGTFDPVHFGHLRCALEILELLALSEVRMIPCGVPPHRNPPVASADDRTDMLCAGIATEPRLVPDTREVERRGPSYMVDTLESLREELGEKPVCLILGGDAFNGLPDWSRWQRLIVLAHIVVMRRPAWEPPVEGQLGGFVAVHRVDSADQLREAPAGCLLFCDVTQLDISASGIRTLLAGGRSARYLNMIRERKLYISH